MAIAAHIRAAMARQTPPIRQSELAKAADIDRSTLSYLLKPSKTMRVEELDRICTALGLSTGAVIDSARRAVADHEAETLRSRVNFRAERAGDENVG